MFCIGKLTWRTPLIRLRSIVAPLLATLCTATLLTAAIPRLISYQGVLTDELGASVPDAVHPMTFAIYDSVAGGNQLWFENRNVATVNGVFDILLGEGSSLSLSFDKPCYLETIFDGHALAPRTLLSASSYSLNAADIMDSVAVRSINGLTDHVFMRSDAGIDLSMSGDTIRIRPVSDRIAADVSGATTDLTADWISYESCAVTISCTGPGIVVCESAVQLQISHTNGIGDRVQLCHSQTSNSQGPDVGYYSVHSVPAEFPTYVNNEITVPVRTVFEISQAGEYTFYLNGRSTQGQGGDRFWYASLTATFHPQFSIDTLPTVDGTNPQIEKPSR